jgi:hypothetical protein
MHDPLTVAFEIPRPWPSHVKPMSVDGRALRAYWYWPPLVTVWHREPGGHDSGDVCQHYTRYQDAEGHWQMKVSHAWKFHVYHWRLQIHSLQLLRRRLLTRCAWCRGRSTKNDPVNFSREWDGPRGHWWQGEPGLYHADCSAIYGAHETCVCEHPVLEYDGYGQCARCSAYRAFGTTEERLARARQLKAIPAGARKATSC